MAGSVPLATLQPGVTVHIHYRTAPTRKSGVICRRSLAMNRHRVGLDVRALMTR